LPSRCLGGLGGPSQPLEANARAFLGEAADVRSATFEQRDLVQRRGAPRRQRDHLAAVSSGTHRVQFDAARRLERVGEAAVTPRRRPPRM